MLFCKIIIIIIIIFKEHTFGNFLYLLITVDLKNLGVLIDFKDIEVYCLCNLWTFWSHAPFLTPITAIAVIAAITALM